MTINADILLNEGWAVCQAPEYRSRFEQYVRQYNLPYTWDQTPFWAYWFSRQIIGDYWPPGEPLIGSDPATLRAYRSYVGVLRQLQILGHTIRPSSEFLVGPDGRIVGRKDEARPDSFEAQEGPREHVPSVFGDATLEEHADRIAKVVKKIKRRTI